MTSRTRYGVSPWADALPVSGRRAYPRVTEPLDVSVAIVGGGLTGTATAYACAAAGVRVALFEADRLGSGGTSWCAGHVLAEPPGDFLDHEARLGRRAARAVWQSTRRASLDLQATLRRLHVRCGLAAADHVVWAAGADATRRLKREYQARRDAGLEASWLTSRALAALTLRGDGGLRTRGQARLDPLRACLGLARAADTRGAALYERSPVTKIQPTRHGVRLMVGKHEIAAERVVLATAEPIPPFGALDRHFVRRESYAVLTPPLPAAVRKAAAPAGAIVQDRHAPPHRLAWTSDDRILWTGADQARTPERTRARVMVQRTGQLMYELSLVTEAISGIPPASGWIAPYACAVDDLPFIGPHRNYPNHLFAWGLGTNVATAFLASRILLRHHAGQAEKDDEPFGFIRFAR